jgi:hypothetical protein
VNNCCQPSVAKSTGKKSRSSNITSL